MAALVEDLVGSAELHRAAGVHDHDLVRNVGHHAKVVRDHDDGVAILLLHLLHELDDLRLDRHVERRGRLVGNEDVGVAGERHGDHHALAHTARELVRILVYALLGLGNAHGVQQLHSALQRLLLGVAAVQAQALSHLLADLVDRVQAGHGVLEDHGDIVAAHVLHLRLGHVEQVVPAVEHGPALDLSRRHGDEAHHGHMGDGLARTGLAHHAEGLAAVQRVGHAVDRAHHAVLGMEVHLEVIDLQQVMPLGNRLVLEVLGGVDRLGFTKHRLTHPSS